jgi:hypothetical protein
MIARAANIARKAGANTTVMAVNTVKKAGANTTVTAVGTVKRAEANTNCKKGELSSGLSFSLPQLA